MASKARKQRRQQRLIHDGRRVAELESKVEQLKSRLHAEIDVGQEMRDELLEQVMRLKNVIALLERECAAVKGRAAELALQLAECSSAKDEAHRELALVVAERDELRAELERLSEQERDAKKLRRRLQEAKEQLRRAQTEASRLRKESMGLTA